MPQSAQSESGQSIPPLPRVAIQQINSGSHWIQLTPEQRHYLERVLRFKMGDPFLALDGSGSLWLATWHRDQAQLEMLLSSEDPGMGIDLHLGLAVIKGNGWDDLIRQLTEIGVTQITPLLSQRTQLEPGSHKLERWRRIAREAAEQCERTRIPVVADLAQADLWWQQTQADLKGIAVARSMAPHLLRWLQQDPMPQKLAIAVGPEGGWTAHEIEIAQTQGWQMISLGSQILRAVTAPVVIASWVAGWAALIEEG